MNFGKFIEVMKTSLEEQLGNEYSISYHEMVKENNVIKHGVKIRMNENPVIPIIYLDSLYDKYINQIPVETLQEELLNTYLMLDHSMYKSLDMSKYQYIKEDLFMRLVDPKYNGQYLSNYVHTSILDLEAVFFIRLDEKYSHTAPITQDILTFWDITIEEVKEQCLKNMQQEDCILINLFTRKVHRLSSDINHNFEFTPLMTASVNDSFYTLTNSIRRFGAAYLMVPDILHPIAETIGTDLVLLLKSIHEITIIPVIPDKSYWKIIYHTDAWVNKNLNPEDRLSEQIYYFHKKTGKTECFPSLSDYMSSSIAIKI